MHCALTQLLPEDHRSIEKRSCKQRDSNERPNYQNVSFSLSSAASFFEWSQMVDVSLLESFPFLTSFYGNGETKFPKTLTIFVRFCAPGRPQRSVRESGSIAYRRRAMPLGRCHRSQRCPLRWLDRVTQRKCDREWTSRDDGPPRDFPDALHNSVLFPALPPTFDRQQAARPGRLWCLSYSPCWNFVYSLA